MQGLQLGLGRKQVGEGVDDVLHRGGLCRVAHAASGLSLKIVPRKGAVLGEDGEGLAAREENGALGGLVLAGDELEKGGFSAPVDADDAELIPLVHGEGDVLQDGFRAEAQGQVGGGEDEHGGSFRE